MTQVSIRGYPIERYEKKNMRVFKRFNLCYAIEPTALKNVELLLDL